MLLCRRCVRAAACLRAHPRHISNSTTSRPNPTDHDRHDGDSKSHDEQEQKNGAMSQRLQQATEDALLTGGKAGRRAVQDAGFSDDLKEHLLDRIARANIASIENQPPSTSFSTSAAAATAAAAAQPWTGEESTAAAVHRMLDDAHKPLRPVAKSRPAAAARARSTPGQRAARAREKAALYSENEGLSDAERSQLRDEFRARFDAVPATISGLAALADERIEEAMARGLFRDLPDRGRPVGEDPLARNPFVDRTEFLMNRIIQRQEIVPPWIEKQQELGRAVDGFRGRLRAEWKRHAARMIAARGGTLGEQMRRAEGHAEAEADDGEDGSSRGGGRGTFRDKAWEEAEHAYLKLSVEKLNGLARSYNLMAPELAKKPYYTLERELARCFRDVAPLIAAEIKTRASHPRARDPQGPGSQTGEKTGAGMGGEVRVYVREGKGYGLREWFNDIRQSWWGNN